MAVNARGPAPAQVGLRRAVLLDKDGTLVENVPYNVDPRRILLAPGAEAALRSWHRAGYVIAVVSNQAGVARGRVQEHEVEQAGTVLREIVAGAGATLAGFYFCPHDPDGRVERYRVACECRKPAEGLLRRAARELEFDLANSWMIGDILDDIEAGRRAGCRTVLIDNGNETEWVSGPKRRPHHLVSRLDQAAELIITLDGMGDADGSRDASVSNTQPAAKSAAPAG